MEFEEYLKIGSGPILLAEIESLAEITQYN
jgi:hypothetical protein